MKWTTANVKNPGYLANHEIYVGTHTGSLKRLLVATESNPFQQTNVHDLTSLNKLSRITALSFGGADNSELLVGHSSQTVEIRSTRTREILRSVDFESPATVGLARIGEQLVQGSGNGKVQSIAVDVARGVETPKFEFSTGDGMTHMRQCPTQPNFIATGGQGRANNLKVFDMEAGGAQIFSSKNLPNDFLQLEVPIWDSDVGFVGEAHTLATCSRHGYVRVYDTRKQRRPVQTFTADATMSFATLAAHGNYIYTGSTMGALKAFDIRRMKTFVHTYKGFTGGISDLCLDETGKFIASACLDRYVRVHDVDKCVLQYQSYVKSKATRILLREAQEDPNSKKNKDDKQEEADTDDEEGESQENTVTVAKDAEYDEIFDKMQTVCESDENDGNDGNDESDENDDNAQEEDEVESTETAKPLGKKRKGSESRGKGKKKKN